MALVFALLVIYQLKHWLCDYPLQRPWMLGKFKARGWVAPLAAHAGVHGVATYIIASLLMATGREYAIFLAIIDFSVHFTMDRIKASEKLMGRWKALSPSEFGIALRHIENAKVAPDMWEAEATQARKWIRHNRLFWQCLGIDQMVHHLTHYYIIWALVH